MDEFMLAKLNIRISEKDKQTIKDYCQKHGITISDFIRDTCLEKIEIERKNNNGRHKLSKEL